VPPAGRGFVICRATIHACRMNGLCSRRSVPDSGSRLKEASMMLSRRVGLAGLCVVLGGGLAMPVLAAPPVNQSGGYAIGGFDVVAYYTKKAAVRGKAEFSYVWREANWLFESAENRDKFAANPAAYAPQYGGYCTMSMVNGKQGRGDPQAWSVRNGKLYLNGNQDVNQRFSMDGDTYISKADSWWKRSYADR
jgi:YHS domain-containing protein